MRKTDERLTELVRSRDMTKFQFKKGEEIERESANKKMIKPKFFHSQSSLVARWSRLYLEICMDIHMHI